MDMALAFGGAVQKSIRHYGDSPVDFLRRTLEIVRSELVFSDEESKRKMLKRLRNEARCIISAEAREIAIALAQKLLREAWEGGLPMSEIEMMEAYVAMVFDRSCLGRLQNIPSHPNDLSDEEVESRMRGIHEKMERREFPYFAKQLANGAKADDLRLPKTEKKETSDLLEMSIGTLP
jgi:hypothetical protein